MVVILIFLTGIFAAITLQKEQLPEFSFDIMKISTVYYGASPEDVEINVTNKIEDRLLEVENIKKITSMSMENLSVIIVHVDADAGDPEKTKSDIRDAVLRVSDLPEAVSENPVIEEMKSSSMPVIEIAISGDVPEHELRKHARELEYRIKEVSGVSAINKIGYRKREIKIDAEMDKMNRQIISFNEIMNAITTRNVRGSGGTIESYVSEKKIVTLAEYEDPLDVKDVIVRSNYEGYQVKLSDIAVISDDFEEPRIMYRGNGKKAIALIISKQENSDIIDLSDELHRVLAEFKKTLPGSVKVDEIYDYSIFTRTMLEIVVNNGLFGFVLVLLVMFLFLDVKSAFWSAFGIPFSILGGIALFIPFGINLNTVTLATMILVLGIIVDDTIVITEKIYTYKQTGMDPYQATINGVKSMIKPVISAVLTTIFAFLPTAFIPGMMGMFMRSIPYVVTIILSISLIEAIFFLPAHIVNAQPPRKIPRRTLWVEFVKMWYHRILTSALRNRKKVLAGYAVLFFVIMIISSVFLKFMLDQDIDQDFFAIVAETPQGTSIERTYDLLPDVEKYLFDSVPSEALKSITTQVGHHDVNLYTMGGGQYSNWAIITIYLIPAANRNIASESIIESLKPGIARLKTSGGFDRLELVPIAGMDMGKAVDVIYTSNDDSIRERFEKETMEYLKSIDGVYSIESSNIPGKNELRLKLDYKELARVGITAMDVARTVRTAFDGTVVTSIRREGEDIDYRVRIKDPKKFRAEGVLDLPIMNREGRLVKMKYFTRIEKHTGAAVHHHYGGKRSVSITADVDDSKITPIEVNDLLKKKFEKKAAGIPGLRIKLSGQEEEIAMSMKGFYFAAVVVLISIYFLLVVLFNSYLQPVLIMSIIPFAVAGVFLTLMVHNKPLILISLIGMLGLIGVVVNDTIVMISHLNEKCENSDNGFKIIADGAAGRFRPVILTTLTTFAGLLPTAYGIGGDLPTIRPLVLTMAWGLVFSTIVTLGLIPLLYSFVKPRKQKE